MRYCLPAAEAAELAARVLVSIFPTSDYAKRFAENLTRLGKLGTSYGFRRFRGLGSPEGRRAGPRRYGVRPSSGRCPSFSSAKRLNSLRASGPSSAPA